MTIPKFMSVVFWLGCYYRIWGVGFGEVSSFTPCSILYNFPPSILHRISLILLSTLIFKLPKILNLTASMDDSVVKSLPWRHKTLSLIPSATQICWAHLVGSAAQDSHSGNRARSMPAVWYQCSPTESTTTEDVQAPQPTRPHKPYKQACMHACVWSLINITVPEGRNGLIDVWWLFL